MKVRANKKIYEVLPFTDNKKKIEEFAGKRSIVKTRIDGVGFAANHDYAVDTLRDRVWFTPGTRILRDQNGDTFWINNDAYIALFGKKVRK